jgi:hypothetical protein
MALVLADRVQETTTTTGTGTVTLLGAVQGFQSFSAVGNGNTTYYTIAGQGTSEWEVGLGTYTSSGTTLSRTTVLGSSNAGSLVNFSAGTKNVFVTYPSSQATLLDATQTLTNKTILGGAISSGTTITLTTQATVDFTSLPSWVKRVTLMFNGVSLSGTDQPLVQFGYGGTPTYVASGYAGGSQGLSTTPSSGVTQTGTGFNIQSAQAANALVGIYTFVLFDYATNTWVGTYSSYNNTTNSSFSFGSIALSGALTAVRLTRTGTNTFDAGKVNILYE